MSHDLCEQCFYHNLQLTTVSLLKRHTGHFNLAPLTKEEGAMKALALLTAAAVTLFSVAASAQTYGAPYGKGKAPPPPPVVTKG